MSKVYLNVASGSTNWNSTNSWSGLYVPLSAEEITLQNSTAALDVNAGLNQQAVTASRLDILQTFSGTIGTAQQTTLKLVSSISCSGTTATVTCNGHGFSSNDIVKIAGATSSQYNGTFTITVSDGNTFTCTVPAGGTSPESETTCTARLEDYLCIGSTNITVGSGSGGSGSGRIKLNLGTAASTVYVAATSNTALDSNMECLRLLGNNASNVLTVVSGKVGIATSYSDETSTFGTVSVIGQGASFTGGSGLTLTNANLSGGSLTLKAGVTTTTVTGGSLDTMPGDYTLTTVNLGPGTLNAGHLRSGTNASISTLYGLDGGTLDLSDNPATTASPFRVTDFYRYPGFIVKLNPTQPQSLVVTNWHDVGVSKISYE